MSLERRPLAMFLLARHGRNICWKSSSIAFQRRVATCVGHACEELWT